MKKIPSWYLKEKLKQIHDRAKRPDPIRDWLFASESRPQIIYLEDKRKAKAEETETDDTDFSGTV